MNAHVLIRPATREDAEGIAIVHVQTWRETYAHLLSEQLLDRITVEDRTRRWHRILSQPPTYRQFVAEVDGRAVGFTATGPSRDGDKPGELELYSIYLLAEQHGTGVGQALLDAAVGDQSAYLWVATDNPRAQAFYRRNRFLADGSSKTENLHDEKLAEIRMAR